MKRPEGFDPRKPGPETGPNTDPPMPPRTVARSGRGSSVQKNVEQKKPGQTNAVHKGRTRTRPEAKRPEPKKSQVRKAARERKRYERGEVRRFTKRSRNRRVAWFSVLGVFVVLFCLVAIAVYSPALALKTVRIDGASRVSAAEVKEAVKDQVGTPLALLDFQRIKVELAQFPLIRSYVTEAVPPNTLIIHIVERAPIGAMADASGYLVVDPAGVTISHSTERPPVLPVIDTGSAGTNSAAFTSAVSVLLALPSSVLSKVDTVTARTNDDVTLVLSGVGQKVVWGSADRSAMKARVLADLLSHQDPNSVVEFDVSAPSNAVVRPG